LEVAVLTVVIS